MSLTETLEIVNPHNHLKERNPKEYKTKKKIMRSRLVSENEILLHLILLVMGSTGNVRRIKMTRSRVTRRIGDTETAD
jgi:hypothetical protein